MTDTTFYVLDNGEKALRVTMYHDHAEVTHYKDSVMYPFYRRNQVPLGEVTGFIESRCFDKRRPDREELLAYLGLDEYDAWEIVRKTNGRMAHDHLSIAFAD